MYTNDVNGKEDRCPVAPQIDLIVNHGLVIMHRSCGDDHDISVSFNISSIKLDQLVSFIIKQTLNKRLYSFERDTKMIIATVTLKLHIPWAGSLKEKRMEVKSLMAKLRNKFNVSVAEVAEQDIHQLMVIAIAAIAADSAQADSIIDHVVSFTESHTDAQLISVEREMR